MRSLSIISLVKVETTKFEKNPDFFLLFSFVFCFELTVALIHVNGNAEEVIVVHHANVRFHPQIQSFNRTNILAP